MRRSRRFLATIGLSTMLLFVQPAAASSGFGFGAFGVYHPLLVPLPHGKESAVAGFGLGLIADYRFAVTERTGLSPFVATTAEVDVVLLDQALDDEVDDDITLHVSTLGLRLTHRTGEMFFVGGQLGMAGASFEGPRFHEPARGSTAGLMLGGEDEAGMLFVLLEYIDFGEGADGYGLLWGAILRFG